MPAVRISTPVNPSEDPDKVRIAVLSLFPEADLQLKDGNLEGEVKNLERFYEQIRRQRILDTTRSILHKGMRGDKTTFRINKQVAFVGKVSFIEGEAVLGPITVIIEDDDLEALIDRLAPETVEGEEIVL